MQDAQKQLGRPVLPIYLFATFTIAVAPVCVLPIFALVVVDGPAQNQQTRSLASSLPQKALCILDAIGRNGRVVYGPLKWPN